MSTDGLREGEKGEKGERQEKDQEKSEKGEKQEKGEDRLGAVTGGLILIVLGLTFYWLQTGVITWEKWWAPLLVGIGVILIATAVIRAVTSTRRGSAIGNLIGGLVLIVIGAAGILEIKDFWPFVLLAAGTAILIAAIAAYVRSPRPG